jgi:hypothetical protein
MMTKPDSNKADKNVVEPVHVVVAGSAVVCIGTESYIVYCGFARKLSDCDTIRAGAVVTATLTYRAGTKE